MGRGLGEERSAWSRSQEVRRYRSILASPGYDLCCGRTLSSILKAWVTGDNVALTSQGWTDPGAGLGFQDMFLAPGDVARTCCHRG